MLFLIALLLAIFLLPSPWGFITVVVALAIDVVEVVVGLWYAKRRKSSVGPDALVGATGIAIGELAPDGQVKVNGEVWSARCLEGCDPGTMIVVRGVDGLTLDVAPALGASNPGVTG